MDAKGIRQWQEVRFLVIDGKSTTMMSGGGDGGKHGLCVARELDVGGGRDAVVGVDRDLAGAGSNIEL